MKRRTVLKSAAATGALGVLTGCLGLGDTNPNVTLSEPDREHSSEELPYKAWGERLPDVTLPAPLDDRSIRIREISTPSLTTFYFSHCQTVCPVLVSALREVQTHAMNNGYGDQVSFVPITFDPARDDAERLDAYAKEMNIDHDAGNWHFLRPESKQRAKQVTGKFGVNFQKQPRKNGSGYMFVHTALIVLANADGYVERAYRGKSPNAEMIIEDLKRLR